MSWGDEQRERSESNPATGKRYGETEREHRVREREEREAIDKEYSGSRSSSGGGSGGSSIGNLGIPGERTAFANFILKLGYAGLILGAALWCVHLASPSMVGKDLPGEVFVSGIACLALVHLFQVVVFILVIVAVFLIWNAGTTPDGFKFSAVPVQAYLMGAGIIVVGYFLKKILSRD